MSYTVGETVTFNFQLFDTAEPPNLVNGKLLSDLVNLSLKLDGVTDATNLLTMQELTVDVLGVPTPTGEYVISFTPISGGHYSLLFTEPSGTLGYVRSATFEVLLAASAITVISDLYDIVVSHCKLQTNILVEADYNEAISSAILGAFSRLSPLKKTNTFAFDGVTKIYPLATPIPAGGTIIPNWVRGISRFDSIEYPINEIPPTILIEGVDYFLVDTGDNSQQALRFVNLYAVGEVSRVTFYAIHAGDGSDLSEYEKRQVAFLAAGYALEKAAAYYLNYKNAAVGDAVAEFRSRSDESATRAREYMGLFYSFWGGDGKTIATSAKDCKPYAVRKDIIECPTEPTRVRFTHKY